MNPALRLLIFKESFTKLGSTISDFVAISVIATFTGIFGVERGRMKIFRPNRYVNASYK